jgi:hypothetical protein
LSPNGCGSQIFKGILSLAIKIGAFVAQVIFASAQFDENVLESTTEPVPVLLAIMPLVVFFAAIDELIGIGHSRVLTRRWTSLRNQAKSILI